jgi:hypothetical protein
VIDLTNPTFTNHVIASVSSSTNSGYDPDGYILGGIVGAGVDLIDGLRAQPINNYASAYSDAADTSMTGTLLNPHAVEAGGTLQYELNYTNNGPSPINPQVFNGSGINPLATSLFVSLLPPGASYVSQNNPDLNCMWGGPGSATLAPLFGTHSSYSILMCLYAGSSSSLAAGQSISTVLDVTYNSPNRNFSAYFLGNTTQTDDDLLVIQASVNSGINNNTNDMFDYLLASGINNFLRIGYLSSSPINNTSNTQSNSILSKTGETGVLVVTVGALLCLITIVVLAATRHKK